MHRGNGFAVICGILFWVAVWKIAGNDDITDWLKKRAFEVIVLICIAAGIVTVYGWFK